MNERSGLISRLMSNRNARESYIRSKLNVLLPSQIRALRLRRVLKQEELGQAADMKQSRISAMERPGEAQFNIETLIRLAAALRVGLKVQFVAFSEMLHWENQFSQDAFEITPVEADAAFLNPAMFTGESEMASGVVITNEMAATKKEPHSVELRDLGIADKRVVMAAAAGASSQSRLGRMR